VRQLPSLKGKRNWFLLNEPPTQPWVLLLDADEFVDDAFCDALARAVQSGLTPPAQPRRGKTLCDSALIFKRSDALRYLRSGLERGTVSEQFVDGWPKNVWAVTDDGIPLEAQRDGNGSYHGYPLPPEDPMAAEVKRFWKAE
jgi:hypothetical protein